MEKIGKLPCGAQRQGQDLQTVSPGWRCLESSSIHIHMKYPYPHRVVVHSNDIMNITGLSARSARRLLERIRRRYGKKKAGFVTVEEFCGFTGMKEESVRGFLK